MLIKRLDFLSPPITFYHQGLLFHSSFVSGILSIISIILIVILTVYYSKELIDKKKPKSFSYNTFIEDSGIFPMNASSLFHFISIVSKENNFISDGIDFSLFRIIGLEDYFELYLNDNNISHYNHWLYGKCNNLIDTKGIEDLIQFDFFESSACIRKYFNKEEQKYYNIGDSKYRWPTLAHGTFNKNYKLYNIIVGKCEDNTLNLILGEDYQCKNESIFEFNQSFAYFGEIVLYIINHYIDISNYTDPYKKYIEIFGNILTNNSYSINHINFNPSIIKTFNGLISDSFNENKALIYERHGTYSIDREKKDIYSVFAFWIRNKLYKTERTYMKLQDVISSVGGVYQSITIIAVYLNTLYNNFVTLSDTEELLHSFIHSEKHKNHVYKKKEHKNQNIQNLKEINNDKIKKDLTKNLYKERYKTEKAKNNKKDKNIDESSYINNNLSTSKKKVRINSEKLNYKDKDNDHDTSKKLELTNFFYYFIFLITCRKKKNYFNFYREFRMKIISEEHLIRNHLNIYNLLRVTERKRNYRKYSYQLNDLIKLI